MGLQLANEPVNVSQRNRDGMSWVFFFCSLELPRNLHSDLAQAIWRDVCLVEWPERLGDQLADEARGQLECSPFCRGRLEEVLLEIQ